MRMHGYCEKCHRVRLIRVTARSIAQSIQRGGGVGVPVGVCDDCEEKERERRTRRTR